MIVAYIISGGMLIGAAAAIGWILFMVRVDSHVQSEKEVILQEQRAA